MTNKSLFRMAAYVLLALIILLAITRCAEQRAPPTFTERKAEMRKGIEIVFADPRCQRDMAIWNMGYKHGLAECNEGTNDVSKN
jgi:hypothetical protein